MATSTTEKTNANTLVQRFNRYVEYRNSVERTKDAFAEQLRQVADQPKPQKSSAKPEPLHSAEENPGTMQTPNFGRSNKITSTQAKRLAHLAPVIEQAARRHNVPVELICGVILQESGANARAVSHCGAKGLMQLMPQTARRFGVKNVFDPAQNIEGGTKYLRWLLDRFDGKIDLALAGYNAGEHNVEKHGNKIPPFKETQNYVPNVLGYTQTMIDILTQKLQRASLPGYARRA